MPEKVGKGSWRSYEAKWLTLNGKHTRSKRQPGQGKAIIRTLVDSGLQTSELCASRVGDYDAATERLYIRRSGRYGALMAATVAALKGELAKF